MPAAERPQSDHVPRFGNYGEAVPGLSIPHPDLAHQAAADQQHPVASQALDVLGRKEEQS